MNIKFIEYDGIKGYTRLMYDDVKDSDKENCFVDVAYSGKDIKAVLEYLFSLEEKIDKAIEYIENCNYGTEDYKIYEIATTGVEELLEILKGNYDKE